MVFASKEELLRVKVKEIAYFESDRNYTFVVTHNKLRTPVRMSLTGMQKMLEKELGEDSANFIRIGKKYIINKNLIYLISIPRQLLVLSDCKHFAFKFNASKDALKRTKEEMYAGREQDFIDEPDDETEQFEDCE